VELLIPWQRPPEPPWEKQKEKRDSRLRVEKGFQAFTLSPAIPQPNTHTRDGCKVLRTTDATERRIHQAIQNAQARFDSDKFADKFARQLREELEELEKSQQKWRSRLGTLGNPTPSRSAELLPAGIPSKPAAGLFSRQLPLPLRFKCCHRKLPGGKKRGGRVQSGR
jgi:hypothetical protein